MSERDDAPLIVISGMAGMFPGAPDIDAYWQRIRAAEAAPLTDLGPRWGVAADRYLAAQPGVPDRTYVDQAYCLPEDAGSTGSDLRDRQARIGQATLRQLLQSLPGQAPANTGLVLATEWTGGGWFETASRDGMTGIPELDLPPAPEIGYAPDAQLNVIADGLLAPGMPRLAVDTACASSLYGLDLARRLLLSGRADAIAVMGLTAWMPLFLLTSFSQLMALSPERRLLPYATNASGIMLGEACGAVLVEPLARALAAGRPVLAVLRSQGLSADGADRSVFAPGRDGQRLMYERAYRNLPPDLDYLEGHGTATKLGDETELAVMKEFYASATPDSLPIGSVKGLIGHTLAAAGICSTIKALLMLRARELPPHNDVTPNEAIAGSPLKLLREATPWAERAERPRRMGVSSFGFGGSNAHVVLEEYRPDLHTGTTFTPAIWSPIAIVDAEQSRGDHLPDTLTIDAQGLRMGPNFLKRLDPYQLLITDLAHRIADRQPELANDENAGVVMGSNLGGALTLKLMRRATWLTRHKPGTKGATARADRFGPKHSLESIASCLPNMCSGYPAFHFNLRGFHQTISGGAGVFWETMALAPRWLEDGADRLLLGAGRMNKWSGEQLHEGGTLLLLQNAAEASRPPLAIIHAIVPAAAAPDFAQACAVAGLPPEQFDWHGISAVQESALGEAAGTDVLYEALQAAQRWAAIEVRDGDRLRFTVLLEKKRAPSTARTAPGLPVTIAVRESEAAAPPAPTAAMQPVLAAPATGSIPPHLARQWVQSTSSALHSFFSAQRATLALLNQSQTAPVVPAPPVVRNLRRSPAHRVISDLQADSAGTLS
ncbi:MAG TPA: polyketide synthase, partial [Rhodocyclaceae bacterium]|nr:polyketide synthase [Rhodocyclaceae bacterium]